VKIKILQDFFYKPIGIFISVVIFIMFQVTILDYIKIFGVKPDIILMYVCFISLVFELKWALPLSIFAGFLKDIFLVTPYDLNAVLFAFFSFSIRQFMHRVSLEKNLMPIAFLFIVFMVTLIHHTLTGLILIYSGKKITLGIFLRIITVQSIYNFLFCLLIPRISKITFDIPGKRESHKTVKVINIDTIRAFMGKK
jgi:rod shape-determining protein MreD